MFYLPLALLTSLVAGQIIDLRRLPDLLVFGLFGSFLATVQDRLMLIYRLWEYSDVGPFQTHAQIALLISLTAAPLAAMRFAQGLRPGARFPLDRALRYTAVSMLPEIAALRTGHIAYFNGWNLAWSLLAYGPIWLLIWGLHRWLSRPAGLHERA